VIFIEAKAFSRRVAELAGEDSEEVLQNIQDDLLSKPDRGAMPPSLCGLRKARIGNPRRGKGKRGGFRYLYLYLEDRQHIHLLLLLDKDEQEDLTAEQRKQMRAMVTELKAKRRKEP
jgi:hypothetical protein